MMPIELTGLFPLWLVCVGALALLLLEALLGERGRPLAPVAAGTFLFLSLASVFSLLALPAMPGALFGGAVVVDLFSLTIMGIGLLSALLTCAFSAGYLRREKALTGEYYALLLFAVAGLFTLVLAADFLTLFVGLELMSLAAYVLAGYFRVKEGSTEAALKYFLAGVFASGFLLLGVSFLYGASGTLSLPDLGIFLERNGVSPLAGAGIILLLVGLGFKTALAPFHAWAPDVYDGAPAPVTVFLSTGVKAAGFAVLTRLFAEVFALPGGWVPALAVLAFLTMILGNLGALGQTSVKRLLAFSSVAHAGYVLVGLAVAVQAPANEVERAVAFYLLAYTLMTGGAFGWLAWASGPGEKLRKLEELKGLGRRHPWMGLAMGTFLFSLAGMTPLAGFFGKFYLFKLAVDHGMTWLAVVGVLNSFVSAYYYLKVLAVLYQKPEEGTAWPTLPLTPALGAAFGVCALGSLVAGFLKFPF